MSSKGARNIVTIVSLSENDTLRIAKHAARAFEPGTVFALCGDLGMGKTVFTRGFVRALEGGENIRVKSPTFALARTYDTLVPVHHMDLYRLEDEGALYELGLSEMLLDEEAFSFVEWGDRFDELGVSSVVYVRFSEHDDDPEKRTIVFESSLALDQFENALSL